MWFKNGLKTPKPLLQGVWKDIRKLSNSIISKRL